MLVPPTYILTATITEHLQTIEASKQIIDTFPLPHEVETNIRRQSILKSSLFSARIEGNPLTLEDVSSKPSADQRKREVMNILKGLTLVHQRGARDITLSFLLQLHTLVMQGLGQGGKLRSEVSAIFNAAGIAVYLPPPPRQIPHLMERLLQYSNSEKEQFIPIRAVLSHYTFEKIHPFLDGNGRVGRLLLQAVLEKGGYGMKGLLTVEEYLDQHRIEYYRALEETQRDVTGYVEFMLAAIADTSRKAKELVVAKQETSIEDYLLPRRAEILHIIKDHRLVAFNQIRRRFMAVNERTLRYDLKRLQDQGLIRKRGITKGVCYEPVTSRP